MYNSDNFIPKKFSYISFIKYTREVIFHELQKKLEIKRKMLFIPLPIPFLQINGFTLSLGQKNKAINIVIINLWPYRKSAKNSICMSCFYLYSVVAHELKHVKIIQDWYEGKRADYDILFSEWVLRHIYEGFFLDRIIRFYLLSKDTSAIKRKIHTVSPIELKCYRYGFSESYKRFSHMLDENEKNIAKTIVESIEFIDKYMEIDYFSSRQAYNRFTHTLQIMNRTVLRSPEKIVKYPILSHIFDSNGLIKSPVQLYAERKLDNAEMIDKILIRMFITMSYNWKSIFEHNVSLFNHICDLSNKYCNDAIDYIKNCKVGEVFLNQSILQDNAAMMIKNVNVLNKLMDVYKIPRTSGTLMPLYYLDDFTKKIQ